MKQKEPKFKNALNLVVTLILFPVVERLFTPIYDAILYNVLSAQITSLKFLSDFLYSRISEGVYVNIPFYIFIVLIGYSIHNIAISYKSNNSCCDSPSIETCCKRKQLNFLLKFKCFLFHPKSSKPLALTGYTALYLLLFLFLLTTNFVNLNITKLTNNIEIIAPYISDYEYKVLKSKYHSISSRSDFDSFNSLLSEHAERANIKLK